MKQWKKTSLITAIGILVLLWTIGSIFDISLSAPSTGMDFSPWKISTQTESKQLDQQPENIIIFLVDGFGFGHLSLSLMALQDENSESVWDNFEVKGWHDPRSVYGPLTDSEASATAMSTGYSTNFGHVGIDKNGNEVETIFELASKSGYSTAIVTDSYVWDGTPAAFVAHTTDETDARDILNQIASSDLDLLFGELEDEGEDEVPEREESIEILQKRFLLLDESLSLPSNNKSLGPIAAIYDEDQVQDMNSTPNLKKLTEVALEYLELKEKHFVLLIESEEMDAASHEHDTKRVIDGLNSIQNTLKMVLEYTKSNKNTLVLFTSDHETGGLSVLSDFDKYPELHVRWSTWDHSAEVVPLFSDGPGATNFSNVQRNWEIGLLLHSMINGKNEDGEPASSLD